MSRTSWTDRVLSATRDNRDFVTKSLEWTRNTWTGEGPMSNAFYASDGEELAGIIVVAAQFFGVGVAALNLVWEGPGDYLFEAAPDGAAMSLTVVKLEDLP